MLLAGLFHPSYMFYLALLVRVYSVRGYCYIINDDVVLVQSFLSRLTDCFFGGVKISELANSTLYLVFKLFQIFFFFVFKRLL